MEIFPYIGILKYKIWKISFQMFSPELIFLLDSFVQQNEFQFGRDSAITANPMESKKKFKPNPDWKLMDQVREVLRYHIILIESSRHIAIGSFVF